MELAKISYNACKYFLFTSIPNPTNSFLTNFACKIIRLMVLPSMIRPYNNNLMQLNMSTMSAQDGTKLIGYEYGKDPDIRKWVIHFPGNFGLAQNYVDVGPYFHSAFRCHFLTMNYRGVGGSGNGSPRDFNQLVEDGCKIIDSIVASGFKRENIIVHGHSFGGAVAIHVAAEKQLKCIASNTFDSILAIAKEILKTREPGIASSTFHKLLFLPKYIVDTGYHSFCILANTFRLDGAGICIHTIHLIHVVVIEPLYIIGIFFCCLILPVSSRPYHAMERTFLPLLDDCSPCYRLYLSTKDPEFIKDLLVRSGMHMDNATAWNNIREPKLAFQSREDDMIPESCRLVQEGAPNAVFTNAGHNHIGWDTYPTSDDFESFIHPELAEERKE